ncbi:MAG: helix-turn-helix domain-containing protein [Burkholderiales bacterium]|jgi:excisionase family DNA binding protein|nr:helix-turn-helix domain-containing protein [Burkholderiales bacterium]
MNTTNYLSVHQAAKLLAIHPITMRRMAANGRLPAFKIGRVWRFAEVDLLAAARAQYKSTEAASDMERNHLCRYTKGKIPAIGGRRLQNQTAAQYAALLAPKTENKRRNGMIGHAPKCGASTGSARNLHIVGKTP